MRLMERLSPIAEKYARIDLSGRKGLSEDEPNIVEFTGFSPELEKNFASVLTFSAETEREIQERVINRIRAAGLTSNIEFFESLKDYPLHATLLEGLSGDEAQKRQGVFDAIATDEMTNSMLEALKGTELEFRYVLIDKGNVVLTAIDIPQAVLEIRKSLAELYEKAGLTLRPLENILHMSVARMRKVPKGEDVQNLFTEYKNNMIRLRHDISANPIKAQISGTMKVPVYNFLTRQE